MFHQRTRRFRGEPAALSGGTDRPEQTKLHSSAGGGPRAEQGEPFKGFEGWHKTDDPHHLPRRLIDNSSVTKRRLIEGLELTVAGNCPTQPCRTGLKRGVQT